jgi:Domain of unknown function (DUF4157)
MPRVAVSMKGTPTSANAMSWLPLQNGGMGLLQRKCACGGTPGLSGECEECSKKKRLGLQTKLKINEPGDVYEREADRVAEQVLAEPRHFEVSGSPPRIERFSGHSNGQMNEAPASVEQALASPGRPLEPALRKDMEQRFSCDFSSVRVHSDAAAQQSAKDVDAHAYTVGNNIVFGSGLPVLGSREGQRLLAHELVHVRQQEAVGNGAGYGLFRDKKEGKPQSPPPKTKAPQPATAATPCVPKFKSLKAEITSSVGVREVNGKCQLVLGTPGKAHGTTLTSQVDVPAACTGTLQYVQLVNTCHSIRDSKGNELHRKSGDFWLDTQDPIDQKQVSSSGTVEFKTNDSPGQGEGGIHIHADDSFKTWLLWQPDQPANAARIPLAMVTWSWTADADAKDLNDPDCAKRWRVSKPKTTPGIGKATNSLPSWKKTAPNDLAAEKGPC